MGLAPYVWYVLEISKGEKERRRKRENKKTRKQENEKNNNNDAKCQYNKSKKQTSFVLTIIIKETYN